MLLDVHMHKPHAASRNFMDALLAFWPGLQVCVKLRLALRAVIKYSITRPDRVKTSQWLEEFNSHLS